MSRYVDVVMIRCKFHSDLAEFAEHSTIPVVNGLSDLYHPCQAMADFLTILEHKGTVQDIKVCYIGDGNNVCNSLINAAETLGTRVTVCCPPGFEPPESSARSYSIEHNPMTAVCGADVVYTDVWVSMGQADSLSKRKAFAQYSVTEKLMAGAKEDAIFMHCLPAHRGEKVQTEVLEGQQSVVFDQAENRMHAQKGILSLLLNDDLDLEDA